MSTDQAKSRIELEVKNFGPIAEAKIDLRPLTVFVGPNNTGKSYLATLIYALHQAFVSQYRDDYEQPLSQISGSLEASVNDSGLKEIANWISAARSAAKDVPPRDAPDPPQSLCEAVRETVRGDTATCSIFADQISRAFGVGDSPQQLIRFNSRRPSEVIIRGASIMAASTSDHLEYHLKLGRAGCSLDVSSLSGEEVRQINDTIVAASLSSAKRTSALLRPILPFREYLRRDLTEASTRVRSLARSAIIRYFSGLDAYAYYLPAGRTGIMHAHNVVVGALVDAAPYGGLGGGRTTAALSGVVADFLRELIVEMSAVEPEDNLIAQGIQSRILQGEARRQLTEAGHPFFTYQRDGAKSEIPLRNASSMVSELSPVVFYLKYLVQAGHVFIVDEPEAHLHPSAQIEFATVLAKLVKSGVRVILTTHSEWMLDQFANLVRMSQLPEDAREGLDGSDAALTPDQFGAWLFETKKRPKGTVVREIDIDPEEGGLGRDYFDTAVLTHNTWAEIGNRLTALGLR